MEQPSPRLALSVPDQWFFKESLTVFAPDGAANVIFSSEPIDPEVDAREYAEHQGELLASEFDGYRELAFEPMTVLGGLAGYMRHFEWQPPEREPVSQIQIYYAAEGRGYTATATTTPTEYPRFAADLDEILDRLRLADAASIERAARELEATKWRDDFDLAVKQARATASSVSTAGAPQHADPQQYGATPTEQPLDTKLTDFESGKSGLLS
jgi:hypothetical protein